MKTVSISNCGRIKLNSFRPLCLTKSGLNAIKEYNLSPFIDASCRREPDFENPYPSISALCRQGSFAPHLKVDDVIVYMTIGRKFQPFKKGYHLVSILQVKEVYETHEIAKNEYLNSDLPIPSNCMVSNNPPNDFVKTGGNFTSKLREKQFLNKTDIEKGKIGKRIIKIWDAEYLNKSKKWKCFVKTEPLFVNVDNPPLISNLDFNHIFGKIPNTRTPNLIAEKQLILLAKIAGLNLKLTND